MPFCQLEYGKIYYDEYGDGVAIMMIHPPAMGRKVFSYQIPLGEKFHLILPDLGGHGDSETKKTMFSTKEYAQEILAVLDHLQIDKVLLCGYSSGGNIVQEFALSFPERTRAIILCGGFPKVHSYLLKYEHIAGMYMVKRHDKLLAKGIASAHTAEKHIRDMLYQHMLKVDRQTWFYCYHESLHFSCLERLPELKVPLYLFYGSRDFNNKHIRLYKKYVPQVQTFIIKKVAHQIITKKPDEFNQALIQIVKQLT